MDLLALPSPQPPLRLVNIWPGEQVGVPEVDAGVEVQVGPCRDVVARQCDVLLAVTRHLGAIGPQSEVIYMKYFKIILKIFFIFITL